MEEQVIAVQVDSLLTPIKLNRLYDGYKWWRSVLVGEYLNYEPVRMKRRVTYYRVLKELPSLERLQQMVREKYTDTLDNHLESARDEAQGLHDELEEWHDNLGDSFPDKADELLMAMDELQTAIDYLESAIDYMSEANLKDREIYRLPVYQEVMGGQVVGASSRPKRCAEVSNLLGVISDTLEIGETESEGEFMSSIEEAMSSLESVDFPRMHG